MDANRREEDKRTADEHRFTQINSQKITKVTKDRRKPFTYHLSLFTFLTHICVYPRSSAVVLYCLRVHSRAFAVLFCVFCAFSRLLGFLPPYLRKSAFICGRSFTLWGNFSALANSWLTCHICSSVRDPLKLGIPVNRIPFATAQYV
jgi:hypothetical protein